MRQDSNSRRNDHEPHETNGDSESHGLHLERCSCLVMKNTERKGRGIFANALIRKGTVVETCPVLVLDKDENQKHVEHTSLYHYTYDPRSRIHVQPLIQPKRRLGTRCSQTSRNLSSNTRYTRWRRTLYIIWLTPNIH